MANYVKWFVISSFLIVLGCNSNDQNGTSLGNTASYNKFSGKTMGTSYNITIGRKTKGIQKLVDQLLLDINNELSTYIPTSTISKFNSASAKYPIQDTKDPNNRNKHFKKVFAAAKESFTITNGAFEPTVMPLVNYWGFGTNKKKPSEVDSSRIKNLVSFVDFNKIKREVVGADQKVYITKPKQEFQLDFSAIAKGYAVDEIAFLLEQNAIGNYLVEIGGEVRARGKNAQGQHWSLALNTPKEEAKLNDAFSILSLENIAVASSGNYRNFYKIGDQIYSHTLNPKTGYPERSNLLSCTIFTRFCMKADAMATACMVAGLEEAKKIIKKEPDLEAYFIYSDEEGQLKEYISEGAKKYLKK